MSVRTCAGSPSARALICNTRLMPGSATDLSSRNRCDFNTMRRGPYHRRPIRRTLFAYRSRLGFSFSKQSNDKSITGHGDALQRPLDIIIRKSRARPSINKRLRNPNDQKRKYGGENNIGWKVCTSHHPNCGHASTQCERGAVGNSAPLWWRKRCRCDCPERAGNITGNKRAICRAVAARVPPRHEMFASSKLNHIDWSRPPPVILEQNVDQKARRKRQCCDQKDNCAA